MTGIHFEVTKNTITQQLIIRISSQLNTNELLMPTNFLESQKKYFDRENQWVKVLQLSIRTRFI